MFDGFSFGRLWVFLVIHCKYIFPGIECFCTNSTCFISFSDCNCCYCCRSIYMNVHIVCVVPHIFMHYALLLVSHSHWSIWPHHICFMHLHITVILLSCGGIRWVVWWLFSQWLADVLILILRTRVGVLIYLIFTAGSSSVILSSLSALCNLSSWLSSLFHHHYYMSFCIFCLMSKYHGSQGPWRMS